MNPGVMMFFDSAPVQVTFTSSQMWVAPANVALLVNLSGHGTNGTAATGAHAYVDYIDSYSQRTYRYTDGSMSSDPEVHTAHYASSSKPADYCDPPTLAEGVPGLESYTDCFRYTLTTVDNGNYVPPTDGVDATGFGKTFPGGIAGPASTTSFSNVAVTPFSSYSLVIPTGASITITYYQ